MALPLIASHSFILGKENANWHGGDTCSHCGRLRYEHIARLSAQHYGYSTYLLSEEIRNLVSEHLLSMRHFRKEGFPELEKKERETLAMLFDLHHVGLDDTGSWRAARDRAQQRRLDEIRVRYEATHSY